MTLSTTGEASQEDIVMRPAESADRRRENESHAKVHEDYNNDGERGYPKTEDSRPCRRQELIGINN